MTKKQSQNIANKLDDKQLQNIAKQILPLKTFSGNIDIVGSDHVMQIAKKSDVVSGVIFQAFKNTGVDVKRKINVAS
jgi:hypothetical protein